MAQVREDGHVEVDGLHARLDQRMTGHLHGDRVMPTIGALAVPHLGQDALHLGGLGRRPRPREGAHHVGRSAGGLQEVPQDLGDRRLAVRPGDPDHRELPGGVAVERRGETGHHGTHGAGGNPRLDHGSIEELGDEVLAQQPHRSPLDRFGGVGMAVAQLSRHAAEQVSGHHAAAVVGDPTDVDGGGNPRGLNDMDVVEEEVHLHWSYGRRRNEADAGVPRLPPSAR